MTNSSVLEKRILGALCKSRSDYEQVKTEVGGTSFSAIATTLKEVLEDYYARDPNAGHCPPEILAERAGTRVGSEKLAKAIATYCGNLDISVSVPNLLLDVRNARRDSVGDRISGLLANRRHGKELDEYLRQYRELGDESTAGVVETETNTDIFQAVGSAELVDTHFSGAATFLFPFPRLNEMCDGGARRGHHLVIFARPEIGKTALALCLVRHWLLSYRCLYIGNEDPMCDIVLRLFAGIVGRTTRDVRENPGRFDDLAFQKGYANFTGVSASPGTFDEVGELIDKLEPDIVVYDQLRNLNVGDDNKTTALEKAALGARSTAKRTQTLAVSLTQAGDSAEGKSHLDITSDIDYSKTGIPGAVDLALGLGGSREDTLHGIRTINVSKNKLGGEHGAFQVEFDSKRGTFREV